MINWSPIGRNANSNQREEFIKIDKKQGIRNRAIEELRAMIKMKDLLSKVIVKLGGDTSLDIYPTGWDKTYGLKHFSGWDVWFVGDRCYKNGNDYELYLECDIKNQAFKTSGPSETASIEEEITETLKLDS